MESFKNVKGTHDIYKKEANDFSKVEITFSSIADLFGYREVRTPVLEHSELFVRGVGESSDVVRKEMYTFLDKGERSLTLRPEFTAGIMRLIVQNKLYVDTEFPIKVFYVGPVFRYERPQQGRYRQFNQFGVESVGQNSVYNDAEVISMAYTMLSSIGLDNVTIKINSLGDDVSRENYKKALKDFFQDKISSMCPDCQNRFLLNPLRILDCKVPSDQEIVKNAPKMSDYLTKESKERFDELCRILDKMEIPYVKDDSLVRGLDYYSEDVFEFHYRSKKGNDYGAIGAGGHYGKLVSEVGGPDLPGVGFSFGVERLVSVLNDDGLLDDNIDSLDAYVMPLGKDAQEYALLIANLLRMNGYSTDMCFDDVKVGAQFKRANKKNAKIAVIIGYDEIANDAVVIKNLIKGEQKEIALDDLLSEVELIISSQENECCDDECGCGCHHEHHEHECGCGCNHEHHNHGCECGCNHEEGCKDCEYKNHGKDEFPCVTLGFCPCLKDAELCECVKENLCKCSKKEGNY